MASSNLGDSMVPHSAKKIDWSDPRLPIGVFDSGMGGLTVWRELRRQLPHESILYLGDTARLPYGGRAASEIILFVREIMHWMLGRGVKAIVMACNTSSALALDIVRQECPVPMLGLILPGARAAVQKGQRIGVLATPATVASHAYWQAIQECSQSLQKPNVLCWEQACPAFVPLIESGRIQTPEMKQAIQEYLKPLLEVDIDTLVYGCTHYPLLQSQLRPLLPSPIRCLDPAVALVEAVARELELWGIRQGQHNRQGSTQFFVSGDPATFAGLAQPWVGSRLRVSLAELQSVPSQSS